MFIEHLLEPGSLQVLFQPIVDLSGNPPAVCAVEALTRGPAGGQFEAASVLFDYVRLKREEVRFDRHCLAGALAAAGQFTDVRIHVNVHAATLERDSGFPAYVEAAAKECAFDPARLMIELVEQSSYFDTGRLLEAVRRLRGLGVRIAMDDVGLGNSNYRMIVDARPDCLKIDRYFVSGCSSDRLRRSVIRSIHQIARDFGATVIAEGVERDDDLQVLREAGVTLFQGFLFAKPVARPSFDLHDAGLRSPAAAALRGRKLSMRKKILLVDDSTTVLMMERMILSKLPYDCVTATNGEEAVARAAAELPDLILMDVIMPRMNGFDAVKRIRQQDVTRYTPIIMVTTRGETEHIQSAYAVGCDDYVTKPINSAELMTKMHNFLRSDEVPS